MNWTEEDIDQVFKDSANQLNVPFQESYWTEMEALLPQTNNKKGLGWMVGGTIACLALLSTFFLPEQMVKPEGNLVTIIKTTQPRVSGTNLSKTGAQSTVSPEVMIKNQAFNNQYAVAQNESLKEDVVQNKKNFSNGSKGAENVNPTFKKDIDNVLVEEFAGVDLIATADERLNLLAISEREVLLANAYLSKFELKRKRSALYLQFGAGLSESFMSTNKDNWMPSLNIGGGYQYSPQGFGFSAGVNLNVAFANNLEINRKSKIYNFGSTNYEQNFRYKQLYTIELPVNIDFRKDRQTFSIGVAPTYIAGSLMKFSELADGQISKDEFYVGQKVGLNHFGLKPNFAYQLELSKGWNVGIQLSTQLIQQVDDSQFLGTNRGNAMSGQITIRKTILKF